MVLESVLGEVDVDLEKVEPCRAPPRSGVQSVCPSLLFEVGEDRSRSLVSEEVTDEVRWLYVRARPKKGSVPAQITPQKPIRREEMTHLSGEERILIGEGEDDLEAPVILDVLPVDL